MPHHDGDRIAEAPRPETVMTISGLVHYVVKSSTFEAHSFRTACGLWPISRQRRSEMVTCMTCIYAEELLAPLFIKLGDV